MALWQTSRAHRVSILRNEISQKQLERQLKSQKWWEYLLQRKPGGNLLEHLPAVCPLSPLSPLLAPLDFSWLGKKECVQTFLHSSNIYCSLLWSRHWPIYPLRRQIKSDVLSVHAGLPKSRLWTFFCIRCSQVLSLLPSTILGDSCPSCSGGQSTFSLQWFQMFIMGKRLHVPALPAAPGASAVPALPRLSGVVRPQHDCHLLHANLLSRPT